ncbi:MAG: hypothetical protein Q4B48_04155 [Syntrophomonadaceae bacterium]|nr:hypothetical protein [Syntrophomonadaceae bacterium]
MKDLMLLKAIGGLDDGLLAEYERDTGNKRRLFHGVRWGAIAACLCLVIAAAFATPALLRGPGWVQPQPGGDHAVSDEPGHIAIPGSNPATPSSSPTAPGATATVERAEVFYNTAAAMVNSAPRQGFAIFAEELSQAGLNAVAPDMRLEWMELSGSAGFYGWGELAAVWLNISNAGWDGRVTVKLTPADKPIYGSPMLELEQEEPTATVINGTECYIYLYETETDVYLSAEFEREGVAYALSVAATAADAHHAKADLYDVMSCYAATKRAPELDSITAVHSDEWRNDPLTLAEAREDADFGPYLPRELPQGFSEESILRFRGNGEDYLSSVWTYGYESLRWKASYITAADLPRLTAAEDTHNYDLALYPIPRAQSVPAELREVVDNPIFSIDELTMDVISARARYVSDDAGDTDGYRMRFSVRYGDVVVEISSKGVSPDWVYRQLMGIAP